MTFTDKQPMQQKDSFPSLPVYRPHCFHVVIFHRAKTMKSGKCRRRHWQCFCHYL